MSDPPIYNRSSMRASAALRHAAIARRGLPMSAEDEADATIDEFTPEQQARIREHIRARGLTFEVFLPESIANWLRQKITDGVYANAGEAAFAAFQDLQVLDRHPDVRKALISAMIKDSQDDPGRSVSLDELRHERQMRLREYANTEPPPRE
jgi:Arc/MetJ-type ribon-helix-helix transcriptional regulator